MWTLLFWKDAAERAIKTFAQAVVAFWLAGSVGGLFDVNLGDTLSVAGLAAAVSLLTSIASGAVTTTPGASLTVAAAEPGRHSSPDA